MTAPSSEQAVPPKIISRGAEAGIYQAFPDACRLQNGDIIAVFYAGYGHVSLPNAEYPRGGRICLVRSHDEGRTWSEPVTIYDDENDNRDSHIAQLSDGRLVCSFFSIRSDAANPETLTYLGPQIIFSEDGENWEKQGRILDTNDGMWVSSAPVREMPEGTLILPIYHEGEDGTYGGVIHSRDGGLTWGEVIPIGKDSKLNLPAETDIILLEDGSLYAALRGDHLTNLHAATSPDLGLTWSPVKDLGFFGHAPHFTRLTGGEILLTYRGFVGEDSGQPCTALRISRDEAKTWVGPYLIDTVAGAYPATVELKDGTVLIVYYEEGEGSAVRVRRFQVPANIAFLSLD